MVPATLVMNCGRGGLLPQDTGQYKMILTLGKDMREF